MSDNRGLPLRRSLSQTPPLQAGVMFGLGLFIAVALAWAVRELGTLITALVVASFLAVGLERLISFMTRRRLPRWLAITILIGGIVLLFCGGIAAIIPSLVREVNQFVDDVPGYYDAIANSKLVERFGGETALLDRAQSVITTENISKAVGGVAGGAAAAGTGLVWTITTLIFTMFILAGYVQLRRGVIRLVAASKREQADRILEGILKQIGAYLIGALSIALCAGLASWIFMVIVGIPYAVVLAVIVALLDLIPQIGATIGAIVVTLVALVVSPMTAVITAIFFIAYQQLENWVVYPMVMRSAVKVSNLASIVSVLVGATLFGVVGVVLAVPVYASIRLIGKELVLPRLDAS